MKRLFIAFVAAVALSTASADIIDMQLFEDDFSDFVPSVTDEDESILVNHASTPGIAAPYPCNGFGARYLSLDTGDATLWRTVDAAGDIYFEMAVQFNPCTETVEPSPEAKMSVYMDAATNIVIAAGVSASDNTLTNYVVTSKSVVPRTWVSLKVVSRVVEDALVFKAYINGELLDADGTSEFPSLQSGNTLSTVGFKGGGALDDFVARTAPYVAAKIGDQPYETLDEALAAADSDSVITLMEDHLTKVVLSKSCKIDNPSGAYVLGPVVGVEGNKVTASVVDNVTTYTLENAFSDLPMPAVVWDGSSPSLDFNTLTRVVGDNTYTLNLNEQNTVGGEGSYVQIGNDDQKTAVTITSGTGGAFGAAGMVTVIMKCSNLNLSDDDNRGLIGLLANQDSSSDNSVKIGLASGLNATYGIGLYSSLFYDGNLNSYRGNAVAFTTGEQTICLTYDSASGTSIYRDGSLIASNSALKQGTWKTPLGIVLGGVDSDDSKKISAQTGMKIEAVAVFTNCLSAAEVANYTFPSQRFADDILVSDINAAFGDESEIWIGVADGVKITGDTTFYATKVHFVCDGSFTIVPPAGNTAVFDFSCVAGSPIIPYSGALPAISGNVFTATTVPTYVTDSASWKGTISLTSIPRQWPLSLAGYGNANSVVEVNGVGAQNASGDTGEWLADGTVAMNLIVTGNGIQLTNGTSRYKSVIGELAGSGTFSQDNSAILQGITINVMTNFTGNLSLNKMTVTFGSSQRCGQKYDGGWVKDEETASKLFIDSDAVLSVPAGFALWSPVAVVFDGPVNFTTDATELNGLVLFENAGSNVTFGSNASFTINGEQKKAYEMRQRGTDIILIWGKGSVLRFR